MLAPRTTAKKTALITNIKDGYSTNTSNPLVPFLQGYDEELMRLTVEKEKTIRLSSQLLMPSRLAGYECQLQQAEAQKNAYTLIFYWPHLNFYVIVSQQ